MTEKISDSIVNLVGNTPIVRLQKLGSETGCEILVKLESFNPMSSVKDRIAKAMVEEAEKDGSLQPDMTIVEPTSGNTGIGLAMVAAAKGYPLVLTMPDTMSEERIRILKALGADIMLIHGEKGMDGAVREAEKLTESNPRKYYMPQQFKNPANPRVHTETTGREIVNATEGKLDYFVAGVGTGGTVTGVGRILKAECPGVKIIAVEPEKSPVLSEGRKGSHKIQGIGAGFVPDVLDLDVVDEILTVAYDVAARTARDLACKEGIFAGVSSGAAVAVTIEVAKGLEDGKRLLTILPDTGERYLTTDLFAD